MKKQIVIIGAGGIGCEAANAFAEKYSAGADLLPLLFDTDETTAQGVSRTSFFSLTSDRTFGETVSRLGDRISRWFPVGEEGNAASRFGAEWNMNRGSCSFRMKAMVALADFLADERKQELEAALEKIPENGECTVLSVASVAGGTGSALILPLSLFVARALAEKGVRAEFCALLSLPGALPFGETDTQKTKSEGNAYAALRELNAVVTGSGEDAGFTIGAAKDPIFGALYPMQTDAPAGGRLFNRVYLVGKTPGVLRREEHTGMLCELLFALSKGNLPTALPPAGETPFAAVSASCLSLPAKEIGKYFALRTVTEYTEELAGVYRRAKEASEAEKEFYSSEKKKDRKAKKNAEPVVENTYLKKICTVAGELSIPGISETIETVSEKLRQGNCCHRFGDRKKVAAAKKAELNTLVKQWREAASRYAADSAEALIAAMSELRQKWRAPGSAESLFAKIGFDGSVSAAAYTALCTLSEELEKYLSAESFDPRFVMQEGEKPVDYLRRVAFLPLPEECSPWFEVPDRARKITQKTCLALLGLIEGGCSAIAQAYAERRKFAALMLLRDDIRRLTDIFDRCANTARAAAGELAKDACMRGGSRSFGFTAFAGDDLAEKEKLYQRYGASARGLCGNLPNRITEPLLSAFLKELDREAIGSGAAFDAAVGAWITDMNDFLLRSFDDSEAFRALLKSGVFGVLYEKDKEMLAALLAQTAGYAEPVSDYIAPNPAKPPRLTKCLLISPGAAKILSPEAAKEWDDETAEMQAGERAMREFLVSRQCLDTEFAFCGSISPLKILALGYRENLSLCGIAALREDSGCESWYGQYCKCGFFSKKYETLAWCPESSLWRRTALPYLDEKTEEKRLADTARAFLYLFVGDDLVSRKNDQKENILCTVQAGNLVPVTANKTPVIAGDLELMWGFLAENEWLTNTAAAAFDAWLEGLCRSLPKLDENSFSADGFAAAIGRTPLMRALGKGARLNELPMTLAATLNAQTTGRVSRSKAFARVLDAVADAILVPYTCRSEAMTPDLIGSLAAHGVEALGETLEKPLVSRLKKLIAAKAADRA